MLYPEKELPNLNFPPTIRTELYDQAVDGPATYGRSQHYFNGLGHVVTIVDRLGVKIPIRPMNCYQSKYNNTFTIAVTYTFPKDVALSVVRSIPELNGLSNTGLFVIKNALENILKHNQSPVIHLGLEYSLRNDAFKQLGAEFYQPELDLVISQNSEQLGSPVCPHPDSLEGNIRNLVNEIRQGGQNHPGAIIGLCYVDRQIRPRPYFVNVGKKVVRVMSSPSTTLEEGVHMFEFRPELVSTSNPEGMLHHHHAISKLPEEFGIYETEREAVAGGDISTMHKREITEINHRTELTKAIAAGEKVDFDRVKLRHDATTAERDFERTEAVKSLDYHRVERAHARDIDRADRDLRVAKFKYSSDVVKQVLGLVGQIVGVLPKGKK